MDAEVYMQQAPGFPEANPHGVYCLIKALYGLKQAGYLWNEVLNNYLLELGYTRSQYDPCIYYGDTGAGFVISTVYVDDFEYTGTTAAVENFEQQISQRFAVKLLGEARNLLQIQVDQDGTNISFSQANYVHSILSDFGMLGAKHSSVPVTKGETEAVMFNNGDHELTDPTAYRSAV